MNVFCGDTATTGEATNQYPVLLGHVFVAVCLPLALGHCGEKSSSLEREES